MKRIAALLLAAALFLALTACGRKTDNVIVLDDPAPTTQDRQETKTDPAATKQDEPQQEQQETQTTPAQEPAAEPAPAEEPTPAATAEKVKLYFSNDAGTQFISYKTSLDKLTAGNLLSALADMGAVPSGTRASSFTSAEDGGKTTLKLDLNGTFAKRFAESGPSGRYMMLGSVVNTFLEAFRADEMTVTAEGKALEGYTGALTAFGSNPNPPDPAETATQEQTAPAPTSSSGNAVVDTALSLEGAPYANGGAGPDSFDNSGFVYYCFKANGVTIPRQTSAMYQKGTAVSADALEKGDVLFYDLDGSGKATYAAIYVGGGKALTSSVSRSAVTKFSISTNWYTERYLGARRYG